MMRATKVQMVAVSPIIDTRGRRGTAAKMMRELGKPVLATTVAAHYRNLADGITVIDAADARLAAQIMRPGGWLYESRRHSYVLRRIGGI